MTDALIEAVERLASDTRYGLRTLETTVAALVPDRSKQSDEYGLLDTIDDRIKDDLVPPLEALHTSVDTNLPRIDRGVTEIFGAIEDVKGELENLSAGVGNVIRFANDMAVQVDRALKIADNNTDHFNRIEHKLDAVTTLLERIAKAQEAMAVALCVRGGS
jgi:methyl-accepting chemotaxis protein